MGAGLAPDGSVDLAPDGSIDLARAQYKTKLAFLCPDLFPDFLTLFFQLFSRHFWKPFWNLSPEMVAGTGRVLLKGRGGGG